MRWCCLQLAIAYAIKFSSQWINRRFDEVNLHVRHSPTSPFVATAHILLHMCRSTAVCFCFTTIAGVGSILRCHEMELCSEALSSFLSPRVFQDEELGDEIAEAHATSAGLKGLASYLASIGIEDCRKACGGHGYLLNSGVAAMSADYVWQTTAEGDFIVMLLQTARFLMKQLNDVARRGQVSAERECLTIDLRGTARCHRCILDPCVVNDVLA